MENPIQNGMIWGYPYFWKHPYIISFHFCGYLRITETLRDTLHSTHAFVRHLRRLRLLESGFSLLPNDPNQQWPMDPWLIGLIRKLLNRGHLLRLLIIHDANSRNYCRITWAGFLSWLMCTGSLLYAPGRWILEFHGITKCLLDVSPDDATLETLRMVEHWRQLVGTNGYVNVASVQYQLLII